MRDLRCLSLDARSMSPSNAEHEKLKVSSPSQANLFSPSSLFQSCSSPKINRPPLLLQPRNDPCSSNNPAPPRYVHIHLCAYGDDTKGYIYTYENLICF